MLTSFKNLILTETGKDTGVVFAGTLINVVSGGLFFIIAPRFLGPGDFGVFSTVIATGVLATSIANFGIDTGILKFSKDEKSRNETFSLALKWYILLGLAVGLIGFFLSGPIAIFLNQPQITLYLKIAFLFTLFLLLTNFFVAALQAKGEFAKASIVNISSNVTRLVLLILSAFFFKIGLFSITLLFFGVTVISVVFGQILLKFKYQKKTEIKNVNFFKYNFWIAFSLIIASVPFDNYFLLKFSGPSQTGLYAAPFKILTFSYQFGGNFTRVLASRLSSFENNYKVWDFSKKALLPMSFFVAGLLVLTLIAGPITRLLFGTGFLGSVFVMQILCVGFIFFFLATIPSSIILYYLGDSLISFLITVARYLAFVALLLALVPSKSAVGAAYAFTISEAMAFASMTAYVFFKLNKN